MQKKDDEIKIIQWDPDIQDDSHIVFIIGFFVGILWCLLVQFFLF